MLIYTAAGVPVRPADVLPKIEAYFRRLAERRATAGDLVEALVARDYSTPIPRCGALLREAGVTGELA